MPERATRQASDHEESLEVEELLEDEHPEEEDEETFDPLKFKFYYPTAYTAQYPYVGDYTNKPTTGDLTDEVVAHLAPYEIGDLEKSEPFYGFEGNYHNLSYYFGQNDSLEENDLWDYTLDEFFNLDSTSPIDLDSIYYIIGTDHIWDIGTPTQLSQPPIDIALVVQRELLFIDTRPPIFLD